MDEHFPPCLSKTGRDTVGVRHDELSLASTLTAPFFAQCTGTQVRPRPRRRKFNGEAAPSQYVGASVPLVRGLTPLRCTLLRKSPPKRKLGRATLESRNARDRLGHPPSSFPLGMPLIACSSASKSSCRSSVVGGTWRMSSKN